MKAPKYGTQNDRVWNGKQIMLENRERDQGKKVLKVILHRKINFISIC